MKYLFTVLILLFCDFAYAQNFGFADATIVYKRGDSILCLIKREVNYGEVITYKVHQGADETQVGSTYIKSIRIASKYIENIAFNNKERLATLLQSGKLTLFNYVETENGETVAVGSGGGRLTRIKVIMHYIIKTGNNYTEVKEKGFEKDLKNLLSDCPTVIAKIENHEYTFDDIPAIIEQYNSCNN